MKIAYLASSDTLPNSADRRPDAFEHDQTVACFDGPFRDLGMVLCPVAWDCPRENWSEYAAALIGTTWDYWGRREEFLNTLEGIESRVNLFNPTRLIHWNSHKKYLRDLEAAGIPQIPTVWLDSPSSSAVAAVFDELESDVVVLKRQVGAGAYDQHCVRRGEPVPAMSTPMMAQPYLPTIVSEGEWSFIFVDREFSHALVKKPVEGDYRVQSLYGGTEKAVLPASRDIEAARSIVDAVDGELLYARVDMLRSESGEMLLMELEIIEPFLYPLQGPELGVKMARAMARKVSHGASGK